MGGNPAKNATFLNTRETQCDLQFFLGVAAHASAELQGPTTYRTFLVISYLHEADKKERAMTSCS